MTTPNPNSIDRAPAASILRSIGWGVAAAVVVLLLATITVPKLMRSRETSDLATRTVLQTYATTDISSSLPSPTAPYSGHASKLEVATTDGSEEQPDQGAPQTGQDGPFIARTASLSIIANDFGSVEAAVKAITAHYHGYIAELSTSAPQNSARTFTATLRIPSSQLEAALTELKQLGRVQHESQSGEDVTKQYVDLAARLKNSRATELRLLNVLRNNAGKVKDILETEKEIERVRGEIEQMEADQRALKTRIDFAGLQLSLTEDFKASLQVAPPSTITRLHNAVVQGYRDLAEGVISVAVGSLEAGPTLLLLVAILFFPARWAWKRWLRARFVKPSAADAV